MKEKCRENGIDFLKTIAAILIVLYHYQQVTGARFEHGLNFYGGKLYFGYVVEFFFVVSGFFMYPYIEKIRNGVRFLIFFLKRYFRIFPVMVVCAVTYVLAALVYERLYGFPPYNHPMTLWGLVTASLGIHASWVIPSPEINSPTWYISVLFLCYCLFYGVVVAAKRLKVSEKYFF